MNAFSRASRHAGIELLRIAAMLMIVTIHCLTKGGVLYYANGIALHTFWALYSVCAVAVNCYVLISGYFLCERNFSLKKILLLWIKVVFYSVIISLILWGFNLSEFSISNLIKVLFPVLTRSYWFVTSYIVLYFLFPFLNKLIDALSKKQMQIMLLVMFFVFCLWSNLLSSFFITPDMTSGFGIIWFVFLYFTGAYLKKHYTRQVKSKIYILVFLACALLTFLSRYLVIFIADSVGFKGRFSGTMLFDYNSFTCFIGAVMLFLAFLNININNVRLVKIITSLASLTFGVYLIHNHILLKNILWQDIIKIPAHLNDKYFMLFLLGSVASVYAVCSLIELLIKLIASPWHKSRLIKKLDSINVFNL